MYKSEDNLKTGVWLYFILLLIEGGLRRWFLPGLSTALLLVRDPVAIYLIIKSLSAGVFPKNKWIFIYSILGVISIFTALLLGHGNILVALYGARILLIQFPVIFIIGRVFTQEDVIKMGRVILMIAIPMTILIVMQFHSPQSAWVNRGVGNNMEGAGFSGTADYMRPPGTFSFITGVCLFFELAVAFAFYFWIESGTINILLLIFSSIAIVIAIPTCISRSLFFQFLISSIFFIYAKATRPDFSKLISQLFFGFFILSFLFVNSHLIDAQVGAFTERFNSANDNEGGVKSVLVDRFLGGLIEGITNIDPEHTIFGQGIGLGTNVGSQLVTGKTVFLISESEWGRVMGESGLVIGLMIIIVRIGMTISICRLCYFRFRNGDYLPWMLLSFGFLMILQGGWAQPNNLGFYVLIGGLIIASFNNNEFDNEFFN